MSQAIANNCCCPSTEVVDVPGAPGNNGNNGINAFSVTQLDFIVPAPNSPVTVIVDTNQWMVVGQEVFVFSAGYFSVTSLAGTTAVTLTYSNYVGNSASGNTVSAGSQISPSGTQNSPTLPLTIANGGTGQATAPLALAALITAGNTGTFIANGVTPVSVTNANVTANSVIIMCLKTVGGTVGAIPAVKTITPTSGFTVAGTASDVSTYSYIIIN